MFSSCSPKKKDSGHAPRPSLEIHSPVIRDVNVETPSSSVSEHVPVAPLLDKESSILGQGTYGCVVKGVHIDGVTTVAIKRVPVCSPSDYERARAEAWLHRRLSHPHIVRFLSWHERKTCNEVWLCMQYAGATNLHELLRDNGFRLPRAQRDTYFAAVARAVHYLHTQRIAHRDLKLENVMIDLPTQGVRLIDFGLAHAYRPDEAEASLRGVCGTLCYAAPEVFEGRLRPYSGLAVDVWSLGILLFTMALGCFPVSKACRHTDPTFERVWPWLAELEMPALEAFASAYEAGTLPIHHATPEEAVALNAMLRVRRRATAAEVVCMEVVRCW